MKFVDPPDVKTVVTKLDYRQLDRSYVKVSNSLSLPMLIQTVPVQNFFVSVKQKKQNRELRRSKVKKSVQQKPAINYLPLTYIKPLLSPISNDSV